ncbi:MAG: hypothetical protein KIT24_10690 [Phycisphaeraceae bacterium]|nr:hypothetical protein [Phycisphaeraceae bacterium]
MWSTVELLEAIAAGLGEHERALAREQAVYGLDALSEVELHPLIASSLERSGWQVVRECVYPGDAEVKRSARDRCDLVLAPEGASGVRDPVRERQLSEGTLFAECPTRGEEADAEDAYWLEVKTVGQWGLTHGVCCANAGYAAELRGLVEDLGKLGRDPVIRFGGVLVVLFTETEAAGAHDLDVVVHQALDRGLPAGVPERSGFAMTDRLGNAWCTVAIVPARCTRWMERLG